MMIVPYNPWVTFYFEAHINVEVVASPLNALAYLFKMIQYVWKIAGGVETNAGHVVHGAAAERARERARQPQQQDADAAEPPQCTDPDEVGDHFSMKQTCDTEAFRSPAGMAVVHFTPRVERLVGHGQRRRSANQEEDDTGLSDQELYFARPPLPTLDDVLFEAFVVEWDWSRTAEGAPNEALSRLATDPPCLLYYDRSGRAIYRGEDPSPLRLNARPVPTYLYYERRPSEQPALYRLKPVPQSKGDDHYARLLLRHVAARSYDGLQPLLRCTDGTVGTAERRCAELGLLAENAAEATDVLQQALHDGGARVRSLFVQLYLAGHAMQTHLEDPAVVAAMSDDLNGDRRAMMLDLSELLAISNRDADTVFPAAPDIFNIELPPADPDREVIREVARYDPIEQRALADSPELALDPEQEDVALWALTGWTRAEHPHPAPDLADSHAWWSDDLEIGLLEGDAGVGKSRVVKRLLAELRARGEIGRAIAYTNLAAAAFDGGMSIHSFGMIPLEPDVDGAIRIELKTRGGLLSAERHQLLLQLRVVVVDEAWSAPRVVMEAFLSYLQRIGCQARVLLVGDSQQIPPIVRGHHAPLAELVAASFISSVFYRTILAQERTFHLTRSWRHLHDPAWAAFLLQLGDGTAPALQGHAFTSEARHQKAVAMPLVTNFFHADDDGARRAAIEWLYGRDDAGRLHATGERGILCTLNTIKQRWNALVNEMREEDRLRLGGLRPRRYVASHGPAQPGDDSGAHTLAEAALLDDIGMMRSVDHSVPETPLTLQVGDRHILASSPDRRAGLAKNRIVTVVELRHHSVVVRLDGANNASTLHTLARARFVFCVGQNKAVKLCRIQLPLMHAWALTVNKSQGMTFDASLLDLTAPYFSHGHGYVAPSRTRTAASTAAYVDARSSLVGDAGETIPVLCLVTHPELLAR